MERGWHAMCEKPMGLTARASKQMIAKAQETGCVLSVAENYRRDPVNRLAKALLSAGVIGRPRLMQQIAMAAATACSFQYGGTRKTPAASSSM